MVLVVTPSKRATPCWRCTTKLPASRSSKNPSAARARGRARRCGSAAAGDVGLGEDRHLGVGQHEAARDWAPPRRPHRASRGRDIEHRRVHALLGQRGARAAPRPGRSRRTASPRSRRRPAGSPRRRAAPGRPPPGRSGPTRSAAVEGPSGTGGSETTPASQSRRSRSKGTCRRGNGSSSPSLAPHVGGERLGQGGLLVEQLHRPVADAPRLDEHHLRPGGQQVGEHACARRRGRGATTPCRRTAPRARDAPRWTHPRAAAPSAPWPSGACRRWRTSSRQP